MLNNTKTSLKGGNKETLDFPLIIEPENSVDILSEWIVSNRLNFEKSKETYGAILFRGFEVDSVDKFENFTKNFVDIPLEYNLRSSPRYSVGKNVYHTTTYPSQYSINMHSESSYAPIHPSNIVFCCINPADERGETPIADNRLVLKNLSESTKMKFLERGVKYVRNLNSEFGLSWEEVFQTSSKDKVEEDCRREGIQFLWKGDQRLELNWCKNAIWEHPVTNEKVWFNHAFFFNKYSFNKDFLELIESDEDLPNNTFYGDGTKISKEVIEEIKLAYEKSIVEFSWEKGDVLFLDNMLISHGRNPYKGNRKIITSLF